MGRKKVLFTVNLFVLACLGVFGLLLQANEDRKIMSVEIKTENELARMKEGRISVSYTHLCWSVAPRC